ncbi:MAG: preprotein translocase subunit SecG [Gammaproteobacteria bacterium]|nr:preprotein translocase subunit SecG [Gammaproteobacteria bacterium]
MYGFLLFLLVLDGLILGVVILLQAGKGGGLAAMGGGASPTEGILAGRQAASVLTRTTWTTGTLFMVLALVLSIMSSRATAPSSILRESQQQVAPTPVLPGLEEAVPADEAIPVEVPAAGETQPPPDPQPDGTPPPPNGS